MLPGTTPTEEKECGDDEQAGQSFSLGVVPLGGRVETLACSLVGFARVRGRFFVENERVGLGRGEISSSEGLLVQRSEQAHGIAYGRILLHCPDNKRGDRRVRQKILSLKDVVEIMLH